LDGQRRTPIIDNVLGAITALAAVAAATVGLIGSTLQWRPFVSMVSGRGAGVVLGAVFLCWMVGYRLTKRTSSPD